MSTASPAPVAAAAENPYVGPRAFRSGERLPARQRETRELANLLIAERIVLLHAPSGAGKTSLIQAALHDRLRKERFRPSPALRVNSPPPRGGDVLNRYTYSVGLGLLDGALPAEELTNLSLPKIVERAAQREPDGYFVLVIDQFEEILLIDPADRENQRVFFRQLGETLASGTVWALLSMREDYMGGLDRFLRYVPGQLSTRYRLDFLDTEAAAVAIREPAAAKGVKYSDLAVEKLVGRLATAIKQTPGGDEEEVSAPYVQPVQLQVVCRKLWRLVSKEKEAKGQPFRSIEVSDVELYADIAAALGSYYAGVVGHAARKTGADEGRVRRWFESKLITPQGFRSQTLTGPVSGNVDPARVLRELEKGYLIRGDLRGDSTWYEIAHDKLVKPILDDNDRWFEPLLEPWQLAARVWAKNEEETRLLSGAELRNAQRRADRSDDLSVDEHRFLEAGHRAERESGIAPREVSRAVRDERIYANGINGLTGGYLVDPLPPSEFAARALATEHGLDAQDALAEDLQQLAQSLNQRKFALPFHLRAEVVPEVGWGIVFSTDEGDAVRDALQPLIEHRRRQVGALTKVFDHRAGEDWRDWLERHGTGPGNVVPERVPYYVLLIGPPERIPFSFQYLLDVEYAVGRLDFDDADGYDRYVQAIIVHEQGAGSARNATTAFFGTRHPLDGATRLSADNLVAPLAKSLQPGGQLANAVPPHRVHCLCGDGATKAALAELLAGTGPAGRPQLLFSATHGMGGWPPGHPEQRSRHGALLCQDWPGVRRIGEEQYFAAADLSAEAGVAGMMLFFFACYGAGTPQLDSFYHTPGQAPPPIADAPFVARLPRALLEAGALAVIGHVERAWGYSFVSAQHTQLLPFSNAIGRILARQPVGHAMNDFNEKYATLSASLSTVLENISFGERLADTALAALWTERNDSQNYVLLGDPAATLAPV